ncbi:unnamed protein product [Prunus brigantina]
MGKSRTDLPSRNGVQPTPCSGRIIRAKQPHASRSPANRPSSHLGRPDPSWPKQRDRFFVTVVRSEQSDRFTITGVVISARLSPSLWFGHSDGSTHAPWSNPWRLSSASRLDRNGRTPRSSGPADKAVERGATSSAIGCGPARSAPSGAPIRRRPANDRGRPGSEAPGSAKRLPEFILFYGDGQTSFTEHIGCFTAQYGEADSDAQKLRLLVHSLTGAAFSWFINLPPNSVRDWSDMERIFHEHFYQTN